MKLKNQTNISGILISMLLLGSSLSVNAETFSGTRLALKSINANLSLSLKDGLLESKGIYLDKESTDKFKQDRILYAIVNTGCVEASERLQQAKEYFGDNALTKAAQNELNECQAEFVKMEQSWKTAIGITEESLKVGPNGEPAKFYVVDKTEISTTDKYSLIRIKQQASKATGSVDSTTELSMSYEPAMGMNPVLQVSYKMVDALAPLTGAQRSFTFQIACKETHIFDTLMGIKIPFKAPEKVLTCAIPDGRGEVRFQILN